MAAPVHHVYVGADTGLLKGVDVIRRTWENVNTVKDAGRAREIVVMCWSGEDEAQVCMGLQDGVVRELDVASGQFESRLQAASQGEVLCGLAKHGGKYITCTTGGSLRTWDEPSPDEDDDDDGDGGGAEGTAGGSCQSASISCGADVSRMRHGEVQPQCVATGGQENALKVWDISRPDASASPVFTAKNVRNDWLNLRVPVWIHDLRFADNDKRVVTAQANHVVHVYDMCSQQRRPVISVEHGEHPLMSIAMATGSSGWQCVVGDSHGGLALLDLRARRAVHSFKGCIAGSVRGVECHPTAPVVASCGLDRFLRIHDLRTKELLHKHYLKSRLNTLLLSRTWPDGDGCGREDEAVAQQQQRPPPATAAGKAAGGSADEAGECGVEDQADESDGDDLWNALDVVTDGKPHAAAAAKRKAQRGPPPPASTGRRGAKGVKDKKRRHE